MKRTRYPRIIAVLAAGALASVCVCSACSTLRPILEPNLSPDDSNKPIKDPFGDYDAEARPGDPNSSMIFRAKRNDGSLELDIPKSTQGVTDFILPLSSIDKNRMPASDGGGNGAVVDNSYRDHPSTMTDREITSGFTRPIAEDGQEQREIEQGLGLVEADDPAPERDTSYLAAVDRIKQLYRAERYEAALLEMDPLIRSYPTDPKLYEMRGTLLDRLGHAELALKSWSQALRLNPKDGSLRQFIERRQRAAAGVPQ